MYITVLTRFNEFCFNEYPGLTSNWLGPERFVKSGDHCKSNKQLHSVILHDELSSDHQFPSVAIIVHNEYGDECQRLLFHERIEAGRFDNVIGSYSMETDTLVIKHRLSHYFWVVPSNKEESYIGKIGNG